MPNPTAQRARERYQARGEPPGRWRRLARAAILSALRDAEAAGDTPAATLKRIDGAYPFGPRAHFPYKAWLVERGIAKLDLGLKPVSREEQIRADRAAQLALSWKEGPK